MMDMEASAFFNSYISPPTYRCATEAPECTRPAPSEWTCGPFSMVRAMRKLARLLWCSGLVELAELCSTARVGYVESLLNKEISNVEYSERREWWFRLSELRDAARSIRKWRIEP